MNYENPLSKRDPKLKNKKTVTAAVVSMILNALLSVFKIVFGALSGTVSLLGDGLNNLSDCGSNIITVVGAKMSSKPADKEHPYGHARGEYVASVCVAFIILLFAFELFTASIEKIISDAPLNGSASVIILSVSIAVKLSMFVFNNVLGKKYSSEALKATAIDSLSDVISSLVVLVSLLVSQFTSLNLDGYAGCLVAAVIFISGVKVLKKPISELLGESPSKEITDEIERRLLSYKDIHAVHDLAVHNYVNKYYASVHAEIDASIDVLTAHEIIDKIEKDFEQNTDVELVIHIDPVLLGDSETQSLKATVTGLISDIDERFTVHDFRKVISGNQIKLVFEVCVPFDLAQSNEQIKRTILSKLSSELDTKYTFLITVEHSKVR